MTTSIVVLNRNYEYWTEASLKKVLKWIAQEKIEIVVTHETEEVGSVTVRMKLPLVVRLLEFVGFKPKSEVIPYSPEAVFHRDHYVCQYYHKDKEGRKFRYKCTPEELTLDHVVPLSKGGGSNFLNCVTACSTCNIKIKKNRTPREAGLELIKLPYIPKRDKNSFVVAHFHFNPNKLSHNKYMKAILGK